MDLSMHIFDYFHSNFSSSPLVVNCFSPFSHFLHQPSNIFFTMLLNFNPLKLFFSNFDLYEVISFLTLLLSSSFLAFSQELMKLAIVILVPLPQFHTYVFPILVQIGYCWFLCHVFIVQGGLIQSIPTLFPLVFFYNFFFVTFHNFIIVVIQTL